MDDIYTGVRKMYLGDENLSDFYSKQWQPDGFLENQYFVIVDEYGEPIDYYIYKNQKFEKVKYPQFKDMKPRNPEQYCALDMLRRRDIPIKLILGKFGSGKTMACVTAALEAVDKGEFEKIVFVRNNVQVKDTDPLGALPGDEYSKTLPYLMPFCDHCGGVEGLQYFLDSGKIEVIPLAFLRGRSIKNSILYSMESENLTKTHIQLIMGRIDEGSELWMDGDLKQRDKTAFDKSQGLEIMIERLKGNKNFGYVKLEKSERSEVAQLADLLD